MHSWNLIKFFNQKPCTPSLSATYQLDIFLQWFWINFAVIIRSVCFSFHNLFEMLPIHSVSLLYSFSALHISLQNFLLSSESIITSSFLTLPLIKSFLVIVVIWLLLLVVASLLLLLLSLWSFLHHYFFVILHQFSSLLFLLSLLFIIISFCFASCVWKDNTNICNTYQSLWILVFLVLFVWKYFWKSWCYVCVYRRE